MNPKVLVTGGAGYIGSHTCEHLLRLGYEVAVYDNLSTGFKESLAKDIHFVEGDILDFEKLSRVLKENKIKSIIHFAGKLNIRESFEIPLEYHETNVVGLSTTLKAAVECQVEDFVFSSTCTVYGNETKDRPITENDPKRPISPYGDSKLAAEKILKQVASESPLKYLILRYFNAAGASVDGRNGQRTRSPYHLVHLAAQAACGKKPYIETYGTDYPTKDGTCVRDYVHIDDLADAHLLALRYLQNGGGSDEFNCGYGTGYSVKEVIQTMRAVSESDFKNKNTERRPGDPASLVGNADKIKRVLNWVPKYNNLETICKTAYEWEKRNAL